MNIDAETISIRRFNRLCAVVGLIFLCLTAGARTWWNFNHQPTQSPDFPQYFMAALIVRDGDWKSLYPIPKPGSADNPGSADASTLRPGYAALASANGVPLDANRFMQPPQVALLLAPLALLSYSHAYFCWILLLIVAVWGISLQASRMYAVCRNGRVERLAGVIILLVCCSPQAHRWVRIGNVSALMGWLIGHAALSLVCTDGMSAGVSLALGAVAKYASVALLPLAVIHRRWKAITVAAVTTVVWTAGTLAVMGTTPFRVFLNTIAPTLGRCTMTSTNDSLCAFFIRISHSQTEGGLPVSLHLLFRGLQGVSLLVVLIILIRRRHDIRGDASRGFASIVVLIAWMLVFSPILWEHYHAYLGPFWGWLGAWSRRSIQSRIMAGVTLAMIYIPTRTPLLSASIRRLMPEPLASHVLWGTVLFFAIAIAELRRRRVNHLSNPHAMLSDSINSSCRTNI